MRIIGFTNAAPASALPLWLTPAQALVPWLSRIRDSLGDALGQGADLPPVQREVNPERPVAKAILAFRPATAASNDPVFGAWPQPARRPCTIPPPQAGHSHALRVVRESDTALRVDCAGRMVMSGKIADICAELDRMALRAARAEG